MSLSNRIGNVVQMGWDDVAVRELCTAPAIAAEQCLSSLKKFDLPQTRLVDFFFIMSEQGFKFVAYILCKIGNGLIPCGFGSRRLPIPTNLSTESVDIGNEPRRCQGLA